MPASTFTLPPRPVCHHAGLGNYHDAGTLARCPDCHKIRVRRLRTNGDGWWDTPNPWQRWRYRRAERAEDPTRTRRPPIVEGCRWCETIGQACADHTPSHPIVGILLVTATTIAIAATIITATRLL